MENMKNIVREGYDKGDYPVAFRRNRTLTPFETRMFSSLELHLREGARILDLGCGIGIPYDIYLRDKGYEITGVDFSEKHLKKARALVKGVRFVQADYTEMSFKRESYDAVISFYSIFHVPRKEQFQLFQTMHRVLRQGGVSLFTLGVSSYEYSEEENWAGSPRMAWSSWSVSEYIDMLEKVGLRIITTEYEGNPGDQEYHCWVLCLK